jgi:hypothetical protein
MSTIFPCAEFQELKRQYESALRLWGQYEFPLHNQPLVARAWQATQLRLKQKAVEARNKASERLLAHKEKCRVCKIEVRLTEWPGRHRIKAG